MCVPAREICDGAADDDCDGLPDAQDSDCQCINGKLEPCEAGKGICAEGQRACVDGRWGACKSLKQAQPRELCDDNSIDEDCDGSPNNGCECTNGQSRSCATNSCVPGTQTCANGRWGSCTGSKTCSPTERCVNGGCREWCTDAACARTGTTCQPRVCDQTTGMCKDGPAAGASTSCSEAGISVGYCESGRCQRDTDVICDVGGLASSQWLFTEQNKTCQPNNCLSTPAGDFRNCRTKKSGQPVIWQLFNDYENNSGRDTSYVRVEGRDRACGDPGCFKWFGNPRVKGSNAAVSCTIFDDDGRMPFGPSRQFVPSWRGEGHPANPMGRDGATVCTPEQCRKWVGDCRVQ